MRILVCGVGSIGERHIRNLLKLGYEDIAVYRTRQLPFRTLEREFKTYSDLGQALAEFRPAVAFITNPTSLHLPVALECARSGCHLFIEKPISHTLTSLDELQAEVDRRGSFVMVGYMLRFHPLFQQVKAWLDEGPEGTLGQPVFVRSSWGEHVPDWHPWEDYRESYSVRPELGGGPALTLSHDLDLLVWMLGPAAEVTALVNRVSPLQAACEHAIDILLRFPNGVTANVHLDYCQRPPQRLWELVAARGRVQIDYLAGTLALWRGEIGANTGSHRGQVTGPEIQPLPAGFDRNDLFVGELEHFFECLRANRAPVPGIREATESVRIVLEALDH